MALAAFQSDQQALDFLYGGPVADPQLNIAPEAPVEMELGPDRMIQAADAAFLDDLDARGEPRLPQEDEDLPPVVPAEQPQAPAPFASDEEALAFLSAGAEERRVETPRPTLEAGQTSGTGFGSDAEALAFLQGAEQRAPEIKLPAPRPTPKPVTTPEAADGTDVTFEKDGPAFQFTGSLVVDPSSGPEQGLDGMVPVAPRGPMAATAAAGQAEPVLNRRPRLVPSAGAQIVFDQSSPERFTQGVEEAFAAGILPQSNYEKIKASEAQIFKVVDDRRKLEERAQADPRLLAILQGAGRGGAMTVGAVGGAKLLAAGASAAALATVAGAPFAPAAAVVGGVAGAIGGGIAAGLGYDAIYNKLGEHFTEYDDVMKAAELFPMHKAGGEMGMVALALPVSVAQGARGLRTAFQDGGLPQVARTAATAGGLGAGTGVVAYPIDAAVRGEEITPGGFAAAAGVGALTGGFFINNRMAGAKDVAAVAAKMKAGTPLTAAETKLAQAAQPAISAAIARMDTAGGVRTGPLEVDVPMTSVAGLVPSVGRAAARVPYRVPVKLPAGAVARAKADVPQALPAPGKAAAADVPVPRTAPVNVLPSGTTVIPMPGPAAATGVAVPRAVSAAMAEPFNWALDTANERGIDLEETETDNWNALLSEHLEIVKSAIDAGEPVSVKAFQVYDLSVPFYDLDPATGMATLNAQTLRDYEEYLGGQDADYRESMADAGAEELLAAVIDLGGLPAPKSGAKRAVWSGELKALYEEAKGAGKGKGGDNQKGVFINKLFRRDGMDLDEMAMALRQKGFRVETEADLIELLGNRLRSGREIFGMATQSMEDVPLEMRGTRRAARPGPRQMDLLGEQDVEFGLMGQTDARSLTPQELAARAEAEAAAATAEAAQTDLFGGEIRGSRAAGPAVPTGGVTAGGAKGVPALTVFRGELDALPSGRNLAEIQSVERVMGIPDGRPTSPFTYYTTDQSDAQGYAERDARLLASYAARFGEGDALKTFQSLHGHEPRSGQVRSFNITPTKTLDLTNMGTMANQFVMTEIVANEMGVKLPENWKWSQVPAAVNQELDDFGLLITDNEAPSWAYLRNRVNVVDAELNRRGLRQQTKEDVLGNLFADWMQKHGYDSVSYMHDTPNGPVKHVAVLQQRATQAGSLSSDPLTPPATVRSGGGTQVPPGAIPVGMAALQTPDWVLARGETSAGRRLIKGVENFRPGQRWGFRSIVDFVNEAVRLEMRRSTTQTSRTHPAHYKPANHVAYTRETQSQINFHEAGHGLEYLLRARLPDVFVPHAAELIALTNRPGSMASDPPASLSPVGQYNYRLGEGVAEWTRLLLTDPATVQNLQVSAAISAAAERFYPGMAKSLRDAARAVNAFQGQDVATRWAMFNAPPNVRPSANELIGAIIRGGEAAVNAIASGSPVSSLDRKITRAIIKQRKETETAYKAALTKARLVRSTNLTPLMSAYNMILSIGAETQLAISGTGTSKGLRIVEEDGSFRYLTGESWTDLRKKVPASKLAQFDQAAWAQESLNRWENGGLEYPGMREGILPEDLKAIVAMAVQDIPNFTRMYKEQSRFHDLILEVKEAGGLISGMDRARMQGARPGYWPLPRVMTAGRGAAGRGRGDMSAGVYRARGSGEAIRNIDEVTEERTREMFEAYYWNRFGLKLYDNMAAVAKDLSLPAEARILAGSTMVKMKMPMKAAASVSKEEALGWVMKSIGDAYEKVLGFRPEVKAEDVNLSWSFRDVWRPVKPTDVNVVSLLRDGVREYYQLGDPAIFGLFASPQTASKMGKAASWLLGPMTQNWKRNITQGAVFALRNLFRDTFTQTLLNPDPIGWVPGWAHTKGVVNKFTKKYPQVFSEGLLLSRVQPSEQEMLASIKHGAIWRWLSEGFYVSQAKDPVIKTVATVLQPSNWLFPIWKTADLINLVTGGPAMSAFFETAGREGAAVAALQRGATDEEALAKYWTASGQFNEHSGIADARIAMSIPGFLNPMLQGVRNVGQKLSDPDPAVRGTAWTRLLVMIPVMFGGAAIARYLMMDEDDKERERQRVVDDRLSFMDLAGFSVPFPYGPEGVMGSVVYNATMDDLLGRPKVDADRTAIMLLKRIVDPGSGLQFFGPQLATIMEANMNWSTFRQKPIVAPWMVQLPASEQYYSTTPEFYRKVGTMMNYSPAKLQYIVQQALSRQADETLRLAESIDRGRPMMEMADVPFVGRLFVRDPIGFGSQAVRSVTAVEDRLRLLDERLKAKGWNMLRDPEFPAEDLGSDQLRHLQVQLAYMEDLRKGMGVLSGMQGVAKYYSLKRDYANERNMRTVQTRYAQSLLIGNRGQIAELEKALELLKQIPQGSPDQVAAEYLDRRF
jgi:hypothetical protein